MIRKLLGILGLTAVAAFATTYGGQVDTTQTTLSAVLNAPTAGSPNTIVSLASCTGTQLASTSQGATYLGSGSEAMQITSLISGTIGGAAACTVQVKRGQLGTRATSHANGDVVWVGNAAVGTGDSSRPFSNGAFATLAPSGACTASSQYSLPVFVTGRDALSGGTVWTCAGGYWGQLASVFIDPGQCTAAVSGTAGTGNDTVVIDGSVPALKASSTAAGASNATFTCVLSMPTSIMPGKGFLITDITYLYSVQTTTATSMVASTFKHFQPPAAAASETASSATLVDDCNTCVQTPAVGSANLASVSAGQYYSEKVAPATPILANNDLRTFVFTFQINQSAAAAQIVTCPGLIVHGVTIPPQS